MKPPITVSIVDDDREVREGFSWFFRSSPGFKCLDVCASAEEALIKLPRRPSEVLLLDIHLPGISGIDCLPELRRRCPATQISMLTVIEDAELIWQSLLAGATGYLLKTTPPDAVLNAVRELHAGGSPMSSLIARKLVNLLKDHTGPLSRLRAVPRAMTSAQTAPELSARERQILDLLAQGLRYKEIAHRLGVSIHTVRTFIRSIYEKLQVHSRLEALIRAGHPR